MSALVVLENAKRWPLVLEEAEVVTAEDYLLQPDHAERRGVRVYNLCRTYGYQTLGYYVSLLAAARGHRPLPSVDTLQDLRVASLVRLVSEDLDALIQRSLAPLQGDRFVLSVYFGRNLAKRYDALSRALFDQYPVPLLRAAFSREQRWRLVSIRPIATSEIPEAHREFVLEQAAAHFRRPHRARRARPAARYDLAILADPEAEDAPSDAAALRRFVRAAREFDIEATIVGAGDYGAIAEFDALFIRETTRVNHHTYRFARRAKAEGLVVIDDPESILRCTNKVFQHELFARRRIPSPRTVIVHEDNAAEVVRSVGLPCVLKRPDGSFSRGVELVEKEEDLVATLHDLLAESALAIAQEFTPSGYDWRIGVLDREPLFACRYYMARGHWQIVAEGPSGRRRFGRVESVALEQAPPAVVEAAVAAASLIGDGLYGVDVKEVDGRALVIEVNDNPNIEAGEEDGVLGEALYQRVMQWFRQRLDARGWAP
jgi:glutathione synthase/RimK-type ligase-like ATP-grasp enzyme